MEETQQQLTADLVLKKKRKPSIKSRRIAFAKNYLKARGSQVLAYKMTYPNASNATATVNGCVLMKKPEVRQEIEVLLEKQGMPKEYFVMKMKELAEAKDKDGIPMASVQWDVVKTGMGFHGLIKKNDVQTPQIQVNYNLDSDKLSGVLNKLSEVTRKLELSNHISQGQVENAEIIEGPAGLDATKEDTQGEEHSSGSI